MKLTRSFLNIYFAIMATFIVSSYVLDEVWRSYLEQDIESYTGYKVMMHAIGDYLDKHPEHEWLSITQSTSKKYQIPLSLKPFSAIKSEINQSDRELLREGNTFVLYHDQDVMLFHLLSDEKTLLTLGPAQMPTRPRLEAFARVGILVIIGGIMLFLSWPMSKDLDQLRYAALRLSEGDFNTQVPKARSSMLASMIATFNMMTRRVKRLVDAHKELTNAVAHELRTPLARSKFALQMLDVSKDEQKQLKYREQIASDINELDELINEMLVYASFDSDKPKLEIDKHNLSELIADIIANQSHYQGEITFVNQLENVMVDCDGNFITRAIINYVTNAQKYGDGVIKIVAYQQDDCNLVSVEDNGAGVDDKLKAILFDAFSRGDTSRNRETGGFGLGLAIVTRVMEWHNGVAWVENSELGGAKFILSWPKNIQTM